MIPAIYTIPTPAIVCSLRQDDISKSKITVAVLPSPGMNAAQIAMVENAIDRSGAVTVVRRSERPEFFKEIALTEQGLADPAKRKRLGKLISADYFVAPSITIDQQSRKLYGLRKVSDGYEDLFGSGLRTEKFHWERTEKIEYFKAATIVLNFISIESGVTSTIKEFGFGDDEKPALEMAISNIRNEIYASAQPKLEPLVVGLVGKDYIRVQKAWWLRYNKDTNFEIVNSVKEGNFTEEKVVAIGRIQEDFPDHLKIKIGNIGKKNRWNQDNKVLKTLREGMKIRVDSFPTNWPRLDIFSGKKQAE